MPGQTTTTDSVTENIADLQRTEALLQNLLAALQQGQTGTGAGTGSGNADQGGPDQGGGDPDQGGAGGGTGQTTDTSAQA